MNIKILTFDTIDSTNTEALRQARLGAEEGLCIVARQQTAGRGRHGRTWVSEPDAGLYFSIVLRPTIEAQYLSLVTLMTGVAVHDTLGEFGIAADIKWVNDLHVDGKKICGILAETTDTPRGLAVIVGVGINIKSSNFPREIADIATSIEEAAPRTTGRVKGRQIEDAFPPSPRSLSEALTKYLIYFYITLQRENGPSTLIDEWRKRSSYFSGKQVRVILENESFSGVTDGLEPNGGLRVKRTDGPIVIVQAGDVEHLRAT